MNWPHVDPKWADPGRSGIARFKGFYVIFTVLSCTVDDAEVLILDTDMNDAFLVGRTQKFSWHAALWQMAKEIE